MKVQNQESWEKESLSPLGLWVTHTAVGQRAGIDGEFQVAGMAPTAYAVTSVTGVGFHEVCLSSLGFPAC